MPVHHVRRHAAALTEQLLTGVRGVLLNGPRQAGKTTLLSDIAAARGVSLCSLDDPTTLQSALTDPVGFVTGAPGLQVIDEVQRAGEPLVLAIKHAMDRSNQAGQFLLAGSTRFLDNPGLTESLAGRLLIQDLLPFSRGEICGRRERFLADAMCDPLAVRDYLPHPLTRDEYVERICLGGYPEPLKIEHSGTRIRWFDSYIRAVVDRDLREMARVREPAAADQVLRACAALTGQEFKTVTLAERSDRSRATVDRYVRLLEAAFLVLRLPPYTRNDLTRAVKHSKLHLVDTGLATALRGQRPKALQRQPGTAIGPLLETFVVNELVRQATWADEQPRLSHFRTIDKAEVDLIIEHPAGTITGLESKAALSVSSADFKHLRMLRDKNPDGWTHGYVAYLGTQILPFGADFTAIPVSALWA